MVFLGTATMVEAPMDFFWHSQLFSIKIDSIKLALFYGTSPHSLIFGFKYGNGAFFFVARQFGAFFSCVFDGKIHF